MYTSRVILSTSPQAVSSSSSIHQIPNTEHMAYRLVRTLVYKRGVGIRETFFWVAPMEIRPPGCLASCGRRKCGSVRCSVDALIADSTDSRTDRWTDPSPPVCSCGFFFFCFPPRIPLFFERVYFHTNEANPFRAARLGPVDRSREHLAGDVWDAN